MLPVYVEAQEALQPYHKQAGCFNVSLILFDLLRFVTHSILFIGPYSIGTLLYMSFCASCVILTQWNYVFLNLL